MVVVFLFNCQCTQLHPLRSFVFALLTSSFYLRWIFNPKTQQQVFKHLPSIYRLENSELTWKKFLPSLYTRGGYPVAEHFSYCSSKSALIQHGAVGGVRVLRVLYRPPSLAWGGRPGAWSHGRPIYSTPSTPSTHLQVMIRKGYGTIEVASRMLSNSIGNGLGWSTNQGLTGTRSWGVETKPTNRLWRCWLGMQRPYWSNRKKLV